MHYESSAQTTSRKSVKKCAAWGFIPSKVPGTYRCSAHDLVVFYTYLRSGQDFDSLVLILEEPGLTLYDRMKNYCPAKQMRIKDACMIGIQLIEIIKNFHERDHIVKNITPQTFSFGRNEKTTKLYVSDLLYMKKFRVKKSLNHI